MEMMTRDCMKTLMEKVYMAKLAVFISVPSSCMMHGPVSARGDELRIANRGTE